MDQNGVLARNIKVLSHVSVPIVTVSEKFQGNFERKNNENIVKKIGEVKIEAN